MIAIPIDKHWIDVITLLGVVVSIVGFLYVTYELFNRYPVLHWVLRIVTPLLLGILVLTPIGVADFAYAGGPIVDGAILYGLIGATIGTFNGAFVEWPPAPKRPGFFKRHALVSFILTFLVWFIVGLVFGLPIEKAFLIGGGLAIAGGVIGGFWRFLSWEPRPSPATPPRFARESHFSWRRGLIGLLCGFTLACVPGLILNAPLDGIGWGGIMGVLSGITASLWPFLTHEPPRPAPHAHNYSWKTFSWKRGLIGLPLAVLIGFLQHHYLKTIFGQVLITGEFLAVTGFMAFGLLSFTPFLHAANHLFSARSRRPLSKVSAVRSRAPAALPVSSEPAPQGTTPAPTESQAQPGEAPSHLAEPKEAPQTRPAPAAPLQEEAPVPIPPPTDTLVEPEEARNYYPPLFSAGGFLLGLLTAFLLGLLTFLLAEILFGNPLQTILSATLTAASFIALAGAIIGAFSRYLFWRAEALKPQNLLGTGALLTLIGFLLQLIPPLIDLFGIPVQ